MHKYGLKLFVSGTAHEYDPLGHTLDLWAAVIFGCQPKGEGEKFAAKVSPSFSSRSLLQTKIGWDTCF